MTAATTAASQQLCPSGKTPGVPCAGTKYPVRGIPHFDLDHIWAIYVNCLDHIWNMFASYADHISYSDHMWTIYMWTIFLLGPYLNHIQTIDVKLLVVMWTTFGPYFVIWTRFGPYWDHIFYWDHIWTMYAELWPGWDGVMCRRCCFFSLTRRDQLIH